MYMYEKTVLKASLLMDFKHLTSQQKLWGVQAGSQGGGVVIVALFCEMLPQLVVRNIAICLPSTCERVAALLALVLQRKVKGFFGVLEPKQSAPYTRHQSFSNVEKTPGIILQSCKVGCNIHVLFCIFYTCLAFYSCIYPVRRIASCRMPTVMADCWSWLTRLGRKMNFHMTVR